MGIHKLKDVQCKAATCTTGTVRKLADGGGLFLWITPDGAKRWRYRYSVQGINRKGESALIEKLLSVGTYPEVSLAEARTKAEKLRQQPDPGQQRKAERQAVQVATSNTFEAVARAWHVRQKHWSEKYAHGLMARLEKYAFPTLGSRPISELESADVLAVLEKIEDAGAITSAHRMLPIFSRIFRYGKAKGYCQHIVSTDISQKDSLQKPIKKKQPSVKPDELPELLRAINAYRERRTQLALRMAVLTFVRASELLKAEWSEIDWDDALWRIPESRMKMRLPLIVPLAPQTIAILKELKGFSCGSQFVFPGHTFEKPLSTNCLLNAFKIMGYAGIQTTHGLRRLASTILNDAVGDDERPMFHGDAVEAQLAHIAGGVRGIYNEALYLSQRRRMMVWWADYLDEAAK